MSDTSMKLSLTGGLGLANLLHSCGNEIYVLGLGDGKKGAVWPKELRNHFRKRSQGGLYLGNPLEHMLIGEKNETYSEGFLNGLQEFARELPALHGIDVNIVLASEGEFTSFFAGYLCDVPSHLPPAFPLHIVPYKIGFVVGTSAVASRMR